MNSNFEIVDLTFPIYPEMLTYPTRCHPKVEITRLGTLEEDGRMTSKIVLGSHTGTHADAPAHFIPAGKTFDQIELSTLVGPASIISFAPVAPLQCITADEIKKKLDLVKHKERLLVHFGWDVKYGEMDYYRKSPYFSEDACHVLVESGVKLIGLDIASADNPDILALTGVDSPNHKIFLEKDIVLVEYMTNMEPLLRLSEFIICILPLKFQGTDGSPVRAVAMVER